MLETCSRGEVPTVGFATSSGCCLGMGGRWADGGTPGFGSRVPRDPGWHLQVQLCVSSLDHQGLGGLCSFTPECLAGEARPGPLRKVLLGTRAPLASMEARAPCLYHVEHPQGHARQRNNGPALCGHC